MKLTDQVCSLDLAKRLKELGVKQDGTYAAWVWNEYRKGGRSRDGGYSYTGGKFVDGKDARIDIQQRPNFELPQWTAEDDGHIWDHDCSKRRWVAAFTVAELGEMLPHFTTDHFSDGYWHVRYAWGTTIREEHYETEKTEADARAKMLIYLLENKLLSV